MRDSSSPGGRRRKTSPGSPRRRPPSLSRVGSATGLFCRLTAPRKNRGLSLVSVSPRAFRPKDTRDIVPTHARPVAAISAMRPLVRWPDVVKALQDADARALVMGRYNASGYCPDDFARRPAAKAVVAEALIRVEDAWEFRRGHVPTAEREAIRSLRRRLELELYQ